MPRCENTQCNKQNLKKADVQYDHDRQQVLCQPCYILAHPGWAPPAEVFPQPQFSYELHLTSKHGFAARVGYGDLSLSFHAPIDDIRRYLGVEVEAP